MRGRIVVVSALVFVVGSPTAWAAPWGCADSTHRVRVAGQPSQFDALLEIARVCRTAKTLGVECGPKTSCKDGVATAEQAKAIWPPPPGGRTREIKCGAIGAECEVK